MKGQLKNDSNYLKKLLKSGAYALCDCYTGSEDPNRLGGSEGFYIIVSYEKGFNFIDVNGYTHKVAIPVDVIHPRTVSLMQKSKP